MGPAWQHRRMVDFVSFLIVVGVTTADPIRLVGYLAAGALLRRPVEAIGAGVIWAVAVEFLVYLSLQSEGLAHRPRFEPLVGAMLVTGCVFLAACAWRARKSKSRD